MKIEFTCCGNATGYYHSYFIKRNNKREKDLIPSESILESEGYIINQKRVKLGQDVAICYFNPTEIKEEQTQLSNNAMIAEKQSIQQKKATMSFKTQEKKIETEVSEPSRKNLFALMPVSPATRAKLIEKGD